MLYEILCGCVAHWRWRKGTVRKSPSTKPVNDLGSQPNPLVLTGTRLQRSRVWLIGSPSAWIRYYSTHFSDWVISSNQPSTWRSSDLPGMIQCLAWDKPFRTTVWVTWRHKPSHHVKVRSHCGAFYGNDHERSEMGHYLLFYAPVNFYSVYRNLVQLDCR